MGRLHLARGDYLQLSSSEIKVLNFTKLLNYQANTRSVCTYLNSFIIVNPNIKVMKFNNLESF